MSDSSGKLLDLAPDFLAASVRLLGMEENGDEEGRRGALDQMRELVEKAMEPDEPGPLVSGHEIDVVAEWLMEVTIGRPLQSPSPSGNGEGRTSNGSKGTSRKAARAGKT
jgi:hypothetical protein